ncbi:MAG: response regulator transcription factor [Thalassotalea sp.]
MGNHILIVEDDENLRHSLADNLEMEGYQVTSFALVKDSKAWFNDNSVDLAIIDIMLPDGDGYELSRWLRLKHDLLILMLTARSLEKDVIEGFISGADDYVSKPYRLNELLLRIKALLRRRQPMIQGNYSQLNKLVINWQLREIKNGQHCIHLTKTAFDILSYLFKKMNNTCSREEILDEVWGKDIYVDNRTIDNFISNLKKQLCFTAESEYQIKTVRGIGYSLVKANRV